MIRLRLFSVCSKLTIRAGRRKAILRRGCQIALAAVAGALTAPGAAGAREEAAINGYWAPPDGGRIEIAPCGGRLCGHVRDDGDPAPEEPQFIGHLLLHGFVYEGDGTWRDGRIHNPRDRRSYRSKLRLLDENRLKVSGCVWIFCGSQVWTRIE
jgi:uncharacterized protein (DUF2147 family)